MNELRELRGTKVARVGLLSRMKSQMGLQIRRRAEPLLADFTLMGFFA